MQRLCATSKGKRGRHIYGNAIEGRRRVNRSRGARETDFRGGAVGSGADSKGRKVGIDDVGASEEKESEMTSDERKEKVIDEQDRQKEEERKKRMGIQETPEERAQRQKEREEEKRMQLLLHPLVRDWKSFRMRCSPFVAFQFSPRLQHPPHTHTYTHTHRAFFPLDETVCAVQANGLGNAVLTDQSGYAGPERPHEDDVSRLRTITVRLLGM